MIFMTVLLVVVFVVVVLVEPVVHPHRIASKNCSQGLPGTGCQPSFDVEVTVVVTEVLTVEDNVVVLTVVELVVELTVVVVIVVELRLVIVVV